MMKAPYKAVAALVSASGLAAVMAMAPAASAAKRNTVELTFYYPVGVVGPLSQTMTTLVNRFNQTHPGIHVNAVFSGNYQQTLAKVETAIQGGNPPDVAVLNHTAQFDLIHLQAIEPLDDVVKAGGFYPALTQPKVQGHFWGVPFQRSTVVLYYNKDAFKKAGLDPSHGPNTWSELVADGQKLQKLGMSGIEIPSDGTVYWEFEPFATEAGHNLGGNDGVHVYFNSAAAKTALQFWMDLSHKYHVMPAGILPWNNVPTDFENQKTAMIVHSSGSMASILQNAKFQVGVSFMPAYKSKYRTGVGGGDLYLFKGIPADHRAAALTFIKWMSAPAQAAWWSIRTGYVPTSPQAMQQPEMQAHIKQVPQAKVPVDQLAYAQPELSTYQLNQVYDVIDSAIQSVIDGQSTIAAALDKAQQQADAILAPYRMQ
ncbi:ABC transporter substrate-binding protein [Alicyclobacillus cellulosilyticus]|uniref:ABC transporter substrate-binding protein n=1 Tax=Alicyclobacillus cellulosilyticus TaxID=1003997 RepID=A0A917KGJ1_9BACL|nr:ABC transporter substrate-binding protein [Alicyclobacillus cellulosilyticus]GGJ12884.1 ABC transporter substrate-binding protein [Alicyclobacillus cellulosilyticus]